MNTLNLIYDSPTEGTIPAPRESLDRCAPNEPGGSRNAHKDGGMENEAAEGAARGPQLGHLLSRTTSAGGAL